MSVATSKFKAIISISGQMGDSVRRMFSAVTGETSKLGRALEVLRTKQSLALSGAEQEAIVKKEEAELNRLIAAQKKAQAEADKWFDSDARKRAANLTKEVNKQIRVVDQEHSALRKLDGEMKAVGVDSSNLARETQKLGASMARMEAVVDLNNKFTAFGSAVGGVGSEIKRLGVTAGIVGGTVGYLFKKTFFDQAASFETLQMRLRNLSKDGADYERNWKWITTFEPTVPFKIDDVTNAFAKLKNIGLDPTNGTLKTIADTASQFGETDMSRPIAALTSADFRNRYTMLGGYGISATQDGKGRESYGYFDKQYKWQVKTIETKNKAIVASTILAIWNDKYKGATDAFMQTWQGMWTSLQSQQEMFVNNVMKAGLFDFMKSKLSDLLDWLNANTKNGNMAKWAKQMGDDFKIAGQYIWDAGNKAISIWTRFDNFARPVLGDFASLRVAFWGFVGIQVAPLTLAVMKLGSAFGSLAVSGSKALWGLAVGMGPLGWAITAAVAAVGLLAYEIYKNWGPLSAFAGKVWGVIKAVAIDCWHGIEDAAKAFFDLLFSAGDFTKFKADIKSLEDDVFGAFDRMTGAVRSFKNTLGDGLFGAAGVFGSGKLDAPTQAEINAGRAQVAANKAKYGYPRAGVIPPMAGARSTTVNNSPTYNIHVTSQPGQEAQTAADTKARLDAQQPALAGGYLHD